MLVYEIFLSIQGEGRTMGSPTVFVRTSGCNLDCRWCDTKYAGEGGVEMSVDEILAKVLSYDIWHVCLTGGEPLCQSDAPTLIAKMLGAGMHVTLETNGSMSLRGLPGHPDLLISMDYKCPSSGEEPKMMMKNMQMLCPKDQLKFIVSDQGDLERAEAVLNEHHPDCPVIFTPVGGLSLEPVVDFVLSRHLDVRVLPQLHKIIWGDRRGV
jgi:7-carboxy-7-deazaguanine synthase